LKKQLKMKTHNPNLLSFTYSECGNFTLPIQQKAVRPALFPYSSKKLPAGWPQWPDGTAPRSRTDFTAVSSFQEEHANTWTHADRATAGCLRIHRRIVSKRIGTGIS
jgi:hypothetical protein